MATPIDLAYQPHLSLAKTCEKLTSVSLYIESLRMGHKHYKQYLLTMATPIDRTYQSHLSLASSPGAPSF